MKNPAIILFILLLTICAAGQQPGTELAKKTPVNPVVSTLPADETEEFEKAINQSLASERVKLLQKFVLDFPESGQMLRAREIISSSRAELADEKLRLGEIDAGIGLFKLAVTESPAPVSDKLFSGVLIKLPANLFFRGQREAAIEVAKLIEEKTPDNASHLLGLATFYLSIENASEAKRLAERSIGLEPDSPAAYHTLGFAHRLSFELAEAAHSFARAVELDSNSTVSMISLAEMDRALGKPIESVGLYRRVLEREPENTNARTGLILSLFDAGEKSEAESEMASSLEKTPNNMALLVGAAYWYAAHGEGEKATELAQRVIAFEPRYTWSYIALARGYMALGDPLSAERTLQTARQYGYFPTLAYELASSRTAAGFFKEAAEGLRESFSVEKGRVKTRLGGRIETTSESFLELLSFERRASIFEFSSANSPEESRRLKSLLRFYQALEAEIPDETEIEAAADEFIAGDDGMKTHRQIFAANQLLEKKKSLEKVLQITRDAVTGVEAALDVRNASAAVLADELYESRKIASTRKQTIIVPNISRPTLSKIIRGRIEEIAGWAYFERSMPEDALRKLRLAITVAPANSAWSRSTYWRLGTVLESEGKQQEALDAYIKGYSTEEQSSAKKLVIEGLYGRLNGSLDGLERRLEAKQSPADTVSIFTLKPAKEEAGPANPNPAANNGDGTIDQTLKVETPAAPTPDPGGGDTQEGKKEANPDELLTAAIPGGETDTEIKISETRPARPQTTANTILDPKSNISLLPFFESKQETQKIGVIEKLPVSEVKEQNNIETLFEPVVIKIPESAKPAGPIKRPGPPPYEFGKPMPDDKPAAALPPGIEFLNALPNPGLKTGSISTGPERPRVIALENRGDTENNDDKGPACEIQVSQEEMTIIGGGGSMGLLVGFLDGVGDTSAITSVSSSPLDVTATREPAIGIEAGKALFTVRSVSDNLGLFNLTFEAPCGRKTIVVKVR